MSHLPSSPVLGIVIVAFNSADVLLDCLESLLASEGVALRIVIVDNCSSDATVTVLRDWAAGGQPYAPAKDLPIDVPTYVKPLPLHGDAGRFGGHRLCLIEAKVNGGFAAGVNLGLAHLTTQPELDRFWVLNPDSVAAPGSAVAFASCPAPAQGFAFMGGRVLYLEDPNIIQIDGGTIDRRTGVTGNIGLYAPHISTPPPNLNQMDFITGASMVVSRRFYEMAGPMPEDYFLYYEEVDWALRRQNLPLIYCPGAVVYHRAGTAIGSPTLGRPASPFSLYFKHRARIRFVRRYFPASLPMAYAYSVAKAAQLWLKGYRREAATLLGASFGRPPADDIRTRLGPAAAERAFAKR